jgi:2-methylcitrate dehydratase PrpD
MGIVINELIENVLSTKFAAFSDEHIENTKKRFIDIVGCAIGGANASGNSMILDLVREWGGKKESTIIVHGDKVPAHNAAMVNCVMCRSYDYEAVLDSEGVVEGKLVGHVCGTTEPTALATAELKGSNGKELITAAILGGDMAARIVTAEEFSFEHGFDISGTANAFGAATVAGKLWGLNHNQMLNAFGIVLNQIGGSFQNIWDGVHTFKLIQGLSARNGIMSVELARKGFTGPKDPLMSKYGYFVLYCKGYRPELLTVELGKRFYTKGGHKLHPGCYANHVAIECGLELHRQYDINPVDIYEVTVTLLPMLSRTFLNQPFEMGDTQVKASFNLPYNVANVLLRKSVKLEHFTDKFLRDPKVIGLAKKVKIVPTGSATCPERGWAQTAWATDLTVKLKDGKEFSTHVDAPRGRLLYPLTKDEIKEKFRRNVAFSKTVSRKKGEEVLIMLDALEEVDDVTKIVKLLVA